MAVWSKRGPVGATAAGAPEAVPPSSHKLGMAPGSHEDLQLVRTSRANLLIIGADDAVRPIIEFLAPDLRQPIVTWLKGEPFQLPPPSRCGTMILQEIGDLAKEDQKLLITWLERSAGGTQVISTASGPLVDMIDSGSFNDALYYRLNTVLLHGVA